MFTCVVISFELAAIYCVYTFSFVRIMQCQFHDQCQIAIHQPQRETWDK